MKQSWKKSWSDEREEVKEKSILLLVYLFFSLFEKWEEGEK